jgi:hypothetical protein
MPSLERTPSRGPADGEYTYRRRLGVREILPAIAVGIGAGLLGFYIARLMLQRTPLRVARTSVKSRSHRTERSSRA